jgi:ATP-dependent Clp protease ATP-binding subunit ClpA
MFLNTQGGFVIRPTSVQLLKSILMGVILLISPMVFSKTFTDMVLVEDKTPFYIDIFEASNDHAATLGIVTRWPAYSDKPARLSFVQATSYCAKQGKRLATLQQWMAAASNLKNNSSYTLAGDKIVDASGNLIPNVNDKTKKGSLSVFNFDDLGIDAVGTVGMTGNRPEWVTNAAGAQQCGGAYETSDLKSVELSKICSATVWASPTGTARCVATAKSSLNITYGINVKGQLQKHLTDINFGRSATSVVSNPNGAISYDALSIDILAKSFTFESQVEIENVSSDIRPRNDYLIIYKETAEHFAANGINIQTGIYLAPLKMISSRRDLKKLSSGGTWNFPGTNIGIVVGRPSGEVNNTRKEIWASANGQYFLLKNQMGKNQNILDGIPREIIPAVDGMFLVLKNHEIIFRNHEFEKNKVYSTLSQMAPSIRKILMVNNRHFALTKDGKNLVFVTDDHSVVIYNEKVKMREIAKVQNNSRRGPQVAITGEGIFLPIGSEKVEYIAFDRNGNEVSRKVIFTKRSSEKIIFYENRAIVTQFLAKGGKANYQLTVDGSLHSMTNGKNVLGAKPTADILNIYMSYGSDWRARTRLGNFDNVVNRNDYLPKILNAIKSKKKTWVNIVGDYGVGKTNILKSLAKYIEKIQDRDTEWKDFEVFHINLATFIRLKGVCAKGCPAGISEDPFVKLTAALKNKKVIVLMDDFLDDAELGPTSAKDAMDAFLGYFRNDISKGKLRIVTTADSLLWRRLVDGNAGLSNMGHIIGVSAPNGALLRKIVKSRINELANEYKLIFEDGIEEVIMNSSSELNPNMAEPARSTSAAESMARKLGSLKTRPTRFVSTNDVRKFFVSFVFDSSKLESVDIADMVNFFETNVVSQDDAKRRIYSEMSQLRLGVVSMDGPLAHMFFVGPSGVGKTYTATLLAEYLEVPMVKVDMKTFEGFSSDSEVVRKINNNKGKPYILLLDDIDKSPSGTAILSELRSMYETGIYAEGTRNELNVRNAILIMTGNYGQHLVLDGKDTPQDELLVELRSYLIDKTKSNEEHIPRHIWSRIQESMIIFKGFNSNELEDLAKMFVVELSEQMKAKDGIELVIGDNLLSYIVAKSVEDQMGAIPVKNLITKTLKQKISDYLFQVTLDDSALPARKKKLPKINKLFMGLTPAGKILLIDNTHPRFDEVVD